MATVHWSEDTARNGIRISVIYMDHSIERPALNSLGKTSCRHYSPVLARNKFLIERRYLR